MTKAVESQSYNFLNNQSLKDYSGFAETHRINQVELINSYLEELQKLPSSSPEDKLKIKELASKLVTGIKKHSSANSLVDNLMNEYDLSSSEGIALMCLAESLLRIPDKTTADLLIQDKLVNHDWKSRVNSDKSMFVNASAWALFVTGKILDRNQIDQSNLKNSLNKFLNSSGAPVIRAAMSQAMKVLGNKFIVGETIDQSLINIQDNYKKGYRYSFDLLGEAAATMEDATTYYNAYRDAIFKIGSKVDTLDYRQNNGISVKLSALHPRYSLQQHQIVIDQLYPKLKSLCIFAKEYNIGLNIDAEESERLELSLDLFDRLLQEPDLKSFDGLGIVVQAYAKRTAHVIDALVDMARQHQHKIMVRLVKGAYWDSEIKRAQTEGHQDYPLFTKKGYTDLSYLYCANKLLQAQDVIYPQFATHNAQTLASIYIMAGGKDYEFQCLYGMSDALSEQVLGTDKLNRTVRIYAPVGNHKTLLAYLVRRILENGANSSFINQLSNKAYNLDDLIAHPIDQVPLLLEKEEQIDIPPNLYRQRKNSAGVEIWSVPGLTQLEQQLNSLANSKQLLYANSSPKTESKQAVYNPADKTQLVGYVAFETKETAEQKIKQLAKFKSNLTAEQRVAVLQGLADAIENNFTTALHILMSEAGKTLDNAIAEVREAIDFLRYYGLQLDLALQDNPDLLKDQETIAVCISPWNFPLAIFIGQIAASFAAGKNVIAKPAEQTCLIAAWALDLLQQQLAAHGSTKELNEVVAVYGLGEIVGPVITNNPKVSAIIFTGSIDVAKILQKTALAQTQPVTLIAETGGQNALVTDTTALPEQLLIDIMQSSFNSAGQRCSALRLLCIQEDNAEEILTLLKRALGLLKLGNPKDITTDVGPVIDQEARDGLNDYIELRKKQNLKVTQLKSEFDLNQGYYVLPTIVELKSIDDLTVEKFGPILHVYTYKAKDRQQLINKINQLGYGLTSCIHSRIDLQVNNFIQTINTGNIYINRNQIGAVVGIQPFGGHGLSGTGPKAGGPLYLQRLLETTDWQLNSFDDLTTNDLYRADPKLVNRLKQQLSSLKLDPEQQQLLSDLIDQTQTNNPLAKQVNFQGITGEDNFYIFKPRHAIAITPGSLIDELKIYFISQLLESELYVTADNQLTQFNNLLNLVVVADLAGHAQLATLVAITPLTTSQKQDLANKEGPLWFVVSLEQALSLYPLVSEVSISWNTAAAGGNATLMAQVE